MQAQPQCTQRLSILSLFVALAYAQIPLNERVLVVYNANVPESKQVASYYVAKRSIPESNRCNIDVSSPDQIKQDEFDSSVKRPIQKCLEHVGKDKILYIVFSFKTPGLLEMGPQTYALDPEIEHAGVVSHDHPGLKKH